MTARPGSDRSDLPAPWHLGRRATLAMLGAVASSAAFADTPPVAPPTGTPGAAAPPIPAPTVGRPAAPSIPSASPPPSPPRPATSTIVNGIDKSKIYYVFFNQTIDTVTMRALRRQLTTLVEAGVAEIDLVIESPGGALEPTLVTYSFIRALPARINTHGQGLVASAANILYLAGARRSADRNARFFFHPAQGVEGGAITAQTLRDREADFDAIDGMVTDIYRDRTTLPPDEIARFGRSQVFYTAEQARAFGVVQVVSDLAIPGDQAARILFLD